MTGSLTGAPPSGIVLFGGGARLSPEREKSINERLRLEGGEYEGQPQFKLNWAAMDNVGLSKDHLCGRTDPFDWNCSCLPKSKQIPVCFHQTQNCYHLLSFHPAQKAPQELAENFARQEDIRLPYNCLIHFAEQGGNGRPIPLTESVLTRVLGVIKLSAQLMWAYRYCDTASVRQISQERRDRMLVEKTQEIQRIREFSLNLLNETIPDCAPKVGYGANSRLAGITRSDLRLGKSEAWPRDLKTGLPRNAGIL